MFFLFFIFIICGGGGVHTHALQNGTSGQVPETVCQKGGGEAELTGSRREERTQRFLKDGKHQR